jgi:CRISPR-associated protein Cas2
MSRGEVVAVFVYDISRDAARNRVSKALEPHAVRVQRSVFEGRMTRSKAKALASRLARQLAPEDSLRVYLLGATAALQTIVRGGAPVEAHDFYLL